MKKCRKNLIVFCFVCLLGVSISPAYVNAAPRYEFAYMRLLDSLGDLYSDAEYALINIDNDNIPELVGMNDGWLFIYTYKNGKIEQITDEFGNSYLDDMWHGFAKFISYVPKKNIILINQNDVEGNTYQKEYRLTKDHIFKQVKEYDKPHYNKKAKTINTNKNYKQMVSYLAKKTSCTIYSFFKGNGVTIKKSNNKITLSSDSNDIKKNYIYSLKQKEYTFTIDKNCKWYNSDGKKVSYKKFIKSWKNGIDDDDKQMIIVVKNKKVVQVYID